MLREEATKRTMDLQEEISKNRKEIEILTRQVTAFGPPGNAHPYGGVRVCVCVCVVKLVSVVCIIEYQEVFAPVSHVDDHVSFSGFSLFDDEMEMSSSFFSYDMPKKRKMPDMSVIPTVASMGTADTSWVKNEANDFW